MVVATATYFQTVVPREVLQCRQNLSIWHCLVVYTHKQHHTVFSELVTYFWIIFAKKKYALTFCCFAQRNIAFL